VFVVDDSVVPRTAARAMLAASRGLRFVGDASTGRDALPLIDKLKPDVVLMDVHMPVMDGPATAESVLALLPSVKIVAWTVSESSDDLVRMMRAGCAGYLLKDAGPAELERALLAALRSESPVPRRMIPEVLRRVVNTAPAPVPVKVNLTSRELEVLRGVAKGHTTKRLATDLGLATPSVETHIRNMFKKLGASNRGEAVSRALKVGLITLSDL
jgi:DNA-binding NarL/FixJ family response regulator